METGDHFLRSRFHFLVSSNRQSAIENRQSTKATSHLKNERKLHLTCSIRLGDTRVTLQVEGVYFSIGNGGVSKLAEVRLQEGESLENALRRFKRKVQQEDIIKEVKRHSFYLKPGEKRRVKAALARKRNRKKFRHEPE